MHPSAEHAVVAIDQAAMPVHWTESCGQEECRLNIRLRTYCDKCKVAVEAERRGSDSAWVAAHTLAAVDQGVLRVFEFAMCSH